MNKLHHVKRLACSSSDDSNGLVCVSELHGRPAMALQYASPTIPSSAIEGNSKTGFFIKVDDKYFGLLFITQSQDEANKFMADNEDVALIATDNDDYHYLTTTYEIKKTSLAKKVLKMMDSVEGGESRYSEFVAKVAKQAGISTQELDKQLVDYI